ncbi:NFACT family protein [Prosthecochloris sp. N3]|uniref:NFACT family protein n=1 Tax=Prosthecochloris ethylica TaxID=2743976 RepID=A0ABR9XT51_9CHLB|nr:NFACT family protein [Prosthecochloris ethylica]MBF0586633.1 NFACT family protein [Prosthecochloris ethylica]MBF0637013.1 NFACT family protein [Prosthecochloris ethylica]NUK47884.1 fibronectin/fibrinogen-binding protein [Prosthecochloris ethylica]
MHRSYFTLYHTARELNDKLAGGYVFEIFSQRKNELTLAFITTTGEHLQLIVVTARPELALCVREGLNRKKRNTAGLMTEITEREISCISMDRGDRIIHIALSGGYALELQLFPAATNVLLRHNGTCIDSFKKLPASVPSRFNHNIIRELEELAYHEELFLEQLEKAPEKPLETRLNAMLPGFDRKLLCILLARAERQDSPEHLYRTFAELFYELLDPEPGIVPGSETTPPQLTILPDSRVTRRFDCMLEALSAYCGRTWQNISARQRLKELKSNLLKQKKKAENLHTDITAKELEQTAQQATMIGQLLLAQPDPGSRHTSPIVVENLFKPEDQPISIKLREELNLRENAERYFKQASKARNRIRVLEHQQHTAGKEIDRIQKLLEEAERLADPVEKARYLEEHLEVKPRGNRKHNKAGKQLPFKTIALSPGITLYIGRNAQSNDQLTFGFAKPRDIWLHARGTAGSHGILKGCSLQNTTEVRRAAEIVAFHSPARHSELVPVIVTEKKYIRRLSKSGPGQVKIDREEVLMVHPSSA